MCISADSDYITFDYEKGKQIGQGKSPVFF